MQTIFLAFQTLFLLSILLATGFGILNFHHLKGAFRWIVYQLIVTCLGEIYAICYSLWYLKKVAFPLYHFLNPIEFTLYALFFYEISAREFTKKFILFTALGLLIFSIVNTIWFQPLSVDNSFAYISGSALMVVFSLIFFYELYQRDDFSTPIVQIPSFWIVSGIFFLYLGSFFVMGLISVVLKFDKDLAPRLYVINLFLNILLYAFSIYGLRWAIRNRKLA